MSGLPVDPSWTVQRADVVLAALSADRDRLAAVLVGLDANPTRRILDSAGLTGKTATEWADIRDVFIDLWACFGAYSDAVDRANEIRGRRGRLDTDRLTQLYQLLCLTPIELSGSSRSYADLVPRMDAAYARITGVLAVVDAVWSTVLPRLDKLDELRRKAVNSVQEFEPSLVERLASLEPSLDAVRAAVVGDPLSLEDGAPELDSAEAIVVGVLAELDRVVALRRGLAERLASLEAVVADVERLEAQAAQDRIRAVSRISGIDFPMAPTAGPGLRRMLGTLTAVPARRASAAMADEVDAVEQDARIALSEAEAAAARMTAPLRLRDELRGRLKAYRGKAMALGLAEDAALNQLYQYIRDLLWTAPCDIGVAASLVDKYQHDIGGRRR